MRNLNIFILNRAEMTVILVQVLRLIGFSKNLDRLIGCDRQIVAIIAKISSLIWRVAQVSDLEG
ncbi:MAG: hypothetical protein DCF25_21270 [Leptolyngbya foveolarum]|uniref:Uncharacterized protein n=1 Tax=Leptolyngbya foveolarum TaxID=47253 RepID=A0A2W4VJK8_9CYAN|nr:MAG: hypothetical protein DCF25_21270 [Leptolyngbya foveolarum]